MILLLWFSVCYFLTATSAVPLRYLLRGINVVLVGLILVVTGLAMNDCCEGRVEVKSVLLRDWCLIAVKPWLNGNSNVSKRVRYASISYETLRTDYDLSGEDFHNKRTFMVVRSSVFVISSAQKMHLARDA